MNSFYYSKYKKYKEKYKNLLGGSEDREGCGNCGMMFCESCAQQQPSDTKQPSGTKQQSDTKQPFVTKQPSDTKKPSGTEKKQQSDEPTINIQKLDGTTTTITKLVSPQIIDIKRYISKRDGIDVDDITLLDFDGVNLPDIHPVTENINLYMVIDQKSVTNLDIVTLGRPLTHFRDYGFPPRRNGYWEGAAEYIFNLSDGTQISCKSKLNRIYDPFQGTTHIKLDWDIVPLPTNKRIIKAMMKILEDRGAKLLPERYYYRDMTANNSLYTKLNNLL